MTIIAALVTFTCHSQGVYIVMDMVRLATVLHYATQSPDTHRLDLSHYLYRLQHAHHPCRACL